MIDDYGEIPAFPPLRVTPVEGEANALAALCVGRSTRWTPKPISRVSSSRLVSQSSAVRMDTCRCQEFAQLLSGRNAARHLIEAPRPQREITLLI
jgi:hypothetical protein